MEEAIGSNCHKLSILPSRCFYGAPISDQLRLLTYTLSSSLYLPRIFLGEEKSNMHLATLFRLICQVRDDRADAER